MADYKSIIHSSHFNFLVGKDHFCLTIHAGVVQNISEPISALINNSQMIEFNSQVTVLEDMDENTSIGFCEYVYTDTYVTPDMAGASDQSFNVFRDAAPDLNSLNMKNREDAIKSIGNSVMVSDSTPAWSST
ncbi:conserved hypothetical protein [Histoplasma capsulatum H143]|uniref:BTB domain-containing protein n=1 Tax=Ajellomyces capsulatus (strain H143) TaxID=544712 RepID=C6H242_AJECH|nr:conserved hypothetical protein [Histoplasma capsulatum H143]